MTEGLDWIGLWAPGGGGRCRDTRAGWLWYCDEHDTHGNADSEEEARMVAGAHIYFFMDPDSQGSEDEDESECGVYVWKVEPPAASGADD